MSDSRRTALITGANRGLGFETARQIAQLGYRVALTSRDGLQGKAAADKLQSESLDVVHHPLDVTRAESARRLADYLAKTFGRLDVLVNNAGIFPELGHEAGIGASITDIDPDTVREALETNTLGTLQVSQAIIPLMRRTGGGRIVNISTGYARLTNMDARFPAYRLSKCGVDAVTCMLAAALRDDGILVNSVDPGWVRTRMGGTEASRSPAEAAEGIVWAAMLPHDGPTGRRFKDQEEVPW